MSIVDVLKDKILQLIWTCDYVNFHNHFKHEFVNLAHCFHHFNYSKTEQKPTLIILFSGSLYVRLFTRFLNGMAKSFTLWWNTIFLCTVSPIIMSNVKHTHTTQENKINWDNRRISNSFHCIVHIQMYCSLCGQSMTGEYALR